jgi:hypothetical protein
VKEHCPFDEDKSSIAMSPLKRSPITPSNTSFQGLPLFFILIFPSNHLLPQIKIKKLILINKTKNNNKKKVFYPGFLFFSK